MATFGTPVGTDWQSGVDALRQGRVEDAIAQLSAFVQANPNSFEGNNFLGVALAQAGRHQEAIAYLTQATRLNPQSAQAHFNLGLARMNAGQNDMARTEFQTALQLDPNHAQARQALARLPAPAVETPTVETPAAGTPAWAAPSPAAPTIPTVSTAEALSASAPAWTTTAQKPDASQSLTAGDFLRAAAFGAIVAIVSALIWDKFAYYTHFKLSLIAIFLGIGVGIAVSLGARGKSSAALQLLGGVLAGLGILFGEVLLLKDGLQDYLAKEQQVAVGFFPALIVSIRVFPAYVADGGISFLSWLFIAFGIYEGWKIPGGRGQGE